jgi:hypothetical protein
MKYFPTVVDEVWRSYLERVVTIATVLEKTKRLEAELELQTLRASLNSSPFSPQEESEFQHIYGKLKGLREAVALLYDKKATNEKRILLGKCRFNVYTGLCHGLTTMTSSDLTLCMPIH